MSNKKTSRDLLSKIKPLLSSTPIMRAEVIMDINDLAILKVEFVVTQEILDKLNSCVEDDK
jgi:hypothetical protein